MSTQTLPRTFSRAGAVVAFTAFAAAGASWVAAPPAAAQGENGDIRVHRVGVPFGVSKDDPVACRFYLDAVNFDILPNIAYIIQAQPPLPTTATVTGIIQLTGGAGHTDVLGLADGQYKLTWVTAGAPKEKVFRINCHDGKQDGAQGPGQIEDHQPDHQQDPQGDHRDDDHRDDSGWGQGGDRDDGPKGGVHAGGGGMVDTTEGFSPVAAAAAVGLVSVCCAVYVRLIRRRPHGAA
ncbi:hypothetical protein J2Z21_005415 [Streptomyces griseochromogenes]|uniref:Gram-positive cocci surface proteins LPxTG domain-containing protein n=1 Tax=Streptomyces griseochromogenes TaxID=68214 RepID=A0A1B1B5P0_9ACTN|nr:hypothetical protein [Streptomyces griseochromogenes]ANP54127.1 hypothetical protein AVL59_35240 [Streptomyces griseochromogenes]MBP2052432.1 hypothetical protein [Streptomyces griseochromogenes]